MAVVVWGIVVLAAFVVMFASLSVWLSIRSNKTDSMALIQQQVLALNEQLSKSLGDVAERTGAGIDRLHERIDHRLRETSELFQGTQKNVGDRLDRNSSLFTQLTERLTKLEESNRQVQSIGEEIAKLQEILRAPKLRGNLGELFLEELLAQILPPSNYEMQYAFRDGQKVDAIIRLPQGHLVPIDAKFPLENFQKMLATNLSEEERDSFRKMFAVDFKRHVDQIAQKYIRPDEHTLDFALMYVPAENVYYEAILRDDQFGDVKSINSYALSKRVVPVSPNSFYAYLQAIVLGLRGLKIEAQAKEIFSFLARIKTELERLHEDFTLVGKHLTNAKTAHEKSEKRLGQIGSRLEQLQDVGSKADEVESTKVLNSTL